MASNDWFDKDFYAVLGVAKDVSAADLKKQYRKLARQFHPDSNPGDAAAEARFKEISEAHAVLSDPKQRQEYDAVIIEFPDPDSASLAKLFSVEFFDLLRRVLAPDGQPLGARHTSHLRVLHRQGANWRIVSHLISDARDRTTPSH